MEAERLQKEFVTLKIAIEEAINKGQKSKADLNDVPGSGLVPNEHFTRAHMNAGSGIVGWVDDF